MRLISAELHGYRRFEKRQQLQLDNQLIALLGPNEAGKTSVLKALGALNDDNPLQAHGPSQDLTRGSTFPKDHCPIAAKFLLEDSDYIGFEGFSSIKWIRLEKLTSGGRRIAILDRAATSPTDNPQEAEFTDHLLKRLPTFLQFSEADRNIESAYELGPFFSGERIPIPSALKNLINTANLDLADLHNAIRRSDTGRIDTLLEKANNRVARELANIWRQSKIEIRFSRDNARLLLHVRSSGGELEIISERSVGLRQFVAMFAFLSRSFGTRPSEDIILLMDEAETHLHYDAQADLVRMLAAQQIARKIIYTTHSIGCLPEDLGAGIRLVQASESEATSEISNKFWSEDRRGLAPILFGMGAATVAFLPIRNCVLTEGPCDLILLPTLLREATGLATLGYQIAPGLSQSSEDQIKVLGTNGKRVMYMVDGDPGGSAIESKLNRSGVDKKFIINLNQAVGESCMIEDFVNKEAYARALNEEMNRSGAIVEISASDIPDNMRTLAVSSWCESKNVREPKKVDVAYRILEAASEESIVDQTKVDALKRINDSISSIFAEK